MTEAAPVSRVRRRSPSRPRRFQSLTMDQTDLLTEGFLALVKGGRLTLAQLKDKRDDGLTYVRGVGVKNVEKELLIALKAIDRAIERIEAEKTDRRGWH